MMENQNGCLFASLNT